jgi:hypothetical protein
VRLIETSSHETVVADMKMDVWNDHPGENFHLFGIHWISQPFRVVEERGEKIFVVAVVRRSGAQT